MTGVWAITGGVFDTLAVGTSKSFFTIFCSRSRAFVGNAVSALATLIPIACVALGVAMEETDACLTTDDGGITAIGVCIATGDAGSVSADA